MKDNKNNLSLNLNLLTDKTGFEKLEEEVKIAIFSVIYFMLKNQEFSIWIEVIYIVLQLLQLMSFPFNPIVLYSNIVRKPMEKRYNLHTGF
jgi:hypothetical protein